MLSDFFEPPPKTVVPEPQRYRIPAWFGPPRGTLPAVVAFERILAQTSKVAVCVTHLAAYPTGFEVDVLIMTADDDPLDPMMFHHQRPPRDAGDGISPEVLRLGVLFADGSKATNTGGFRRDRKPPADPVMHARGGGGGGGSWRQTHWVGRCRRPAQFSWSANGPRWTSR